jgi:hypothetical protein
MTLTKADPVLAELWDNPKDSAYDRCIDRTADEV